MAALNQGICEQGMQRTRKYTVLISKERPTQNWPKLIIAMFFSVFINGFNFAIRAACTVQRYHQDDYHRPITFVIALIIEGLEGGGPLQTGRHEWALGGGL